MLAPTVKNPVLITAGSSVPAHISDVGHTDVEVINLTADGQSDQILHIDNFA